MKLYKSVPVGEIGDEFETEILSESDDIGALKALGFSHAEELGIENRLWISEPVMGDKKIKDAGRWFMHLPNETILTICE